mgnify:CR=1 FL=1
MSKQSSKNKKTARINKKTLLIGGAALLIAAAIVSIIIFTPSKNYTVAFYKIEDRQRQGITETIQKIAADKKISP